MDITPLTASGVAIGVHASAAVFALIVGTAVLIMPKGNAVHRITGRVWLAAMTVTAISSFFITELRLFGPYSPIHLLSIATIYWVVDGVRKIRKGDLAGHRRTMIALYVGALVLAGAFTLVPGRRMRAVLFADGGTSAVALAAIASLLLAAGLAMRHRKRLGRFART